MCYITIEELKNNLDYYLNKSSNEDIYVSENGEIIACLTNPQYKSQMELDEILSSTDIKDSTISDDEALYKELAKKHLKK